MAGKISHLHAAKEAKKDEFYTQLTDIEKELSHYTKHFKDKVVFCNCDDPEQSNFWLYFKLNFNVLGLKKLISTHYEQGKQTYKLEYDGINDPVKTDLNGDGDFRSEECVELLKEADIIATNPPFSLFRSYIQQLMDYNKKFIIIGNINAVSYKEIFPLIKDNKLWIGYKFNGAPMMFRVPKDYEITGSVVQKDADGNTLVGVGGTCWFTNLDIPKRHEPLELYKTYNAKEYPKYDNYDAININKTKEIPKDYDGVMGVPISFLDKYCPEQFEIVRFRKGNDEKDLCVDGKCPYFRILIKKKTVTEEVEENK